MLSLKKNLRNNVGADCPFFIQSADFDQVIVFHRKNGCKFVITNYSRHDSNIGTGSKFFVNGSNNYFYDKFSDAQEITDHLVTIQIAWIELKFEPKYMQMMWDDICKKDEDGTLLTNFEQNFKMMAKINERFSNDKMLHVVECDRENQSIRVIVTETELKGLNILINLKKEYIVTGGQKGNWSDKKSRPFKSTAFALCTSTRTHHDKGVEEISELREIFFDILDEEQELFEDALRETIYDDITGKLVYADQDTDEDEISIHEEYLGSNSSDSSDKRETRIDMDNGYGDDFNLF
jgi:hypothetical protein